MWAKDDALLLGQVQGPLPSNLVFGSAVVPRSEDVAPGQGSCADPKPYRSPFGHGTNKSFPPGDATARATGTIVVEVVKVTRVAIVKRVDRDEDRREVDFK
jgi:hypothetical protein